MTEALVYQVELLHPRRPVLLASYTPPSASGVVGHVTRHVYDVAGRETSVTQAYGTPDATTTSYAYDDAGRKTSETDSLGHTTIYNYDAAGNLTSVSGVGGAFTYSYDNARNRISMTDGNG